MHRFVLDGCVCTLCVHTHSFQHQQPHTPHRRRRQRQKKGGRRHRLGRHPWPRTCGRTRRERGRGWGQHVRGGQSRGHQSPPWGRSSSSKPGHSPSFQQTPARVRIVCPLVSACKCDAIQQQTERWIIHTCKINATSINVFMIERVYRLNQQPNTIQLYLLGIWALGAVESIIAEGEILAGKQLLDRIKVEALFQHTDVVLSAIENLCDLSAWIVCVRAHTHALSLIASSTSTVTVFPSAPLTSVWPTVSISISGKSSADLISEMLLVYSKILSVTCVNEFALMRPPVVCLSCALCCLL